MGLWEDSNTYIDLQQLSMVSMIFLIIQFVYEQTRIS